MRARTVALLGLGSLRGVRVTEGSLLALDRYRVDALPDGRIQGRSASPENDGSARLTGRRIACPSTRSRPTGRVPLPG